MKNKFILLILNLHLIYGDKFGGLYPRESPTRDLKSLDGLWDFRLAPLNTPDIGFTEEWYQEDLQKTGDVLKMAVPSSYNDVTTEKSLRDHTGWAWYDRRFYIPRRWIEDKQRIVLRFGSAHYYTMVYVNGNLVVTHEGGHLPIMADISDLVTYEQMNRVTVAINNTLTPLTIPQGEITYKTDITRYPEGFFEQTYSFDFFNYAGIHRPVFLYTTPTNYIEDITIDTDVQLDTGIINYSIEMNGTNSLKESGCSLKIYDHLDNHVTSAIGCIGSIAIPNATLWWPYLMHETPGYQYTVMVTLSNGDGTYDVYPQKVGIRKLGWNSTSLTINEKPLYLQGVGKHEDADIRGKGFDNALLVRDFSLLKWLGANSFRTSHYPYAEEIMDMADAEGIMVIDEAPAVGLTGFGDALLQKHISVMEELYQRDKNRPSVVMWSVGNEPKSYELAAKNYFRDVIAATKALDYSRPVTCVLSVALLQDLAAPSVDVILLNRYYSWYGDTGRTEVIQLQTIDEATAWHAMYDKPVMMSEYGAGSLSGLHSLPSFSWSEEYQVDLMLENFKAFDQLRASGFFVGEHIWNFADFATPQEYTRPPGCMKGLFTRERQPKQAAFIVRKRYNSLNQLSQRPTC